MSMLSWHQVAAPSMSSRSSSVSRSTICRSEGIAWSQAVRRSAHLVCILILFGQDTSSVTGTVRYLVAAVEAMLASPRAWMTVISPCCAPINTMASPSFDLPSRAHWARACPLTLRLIRKICNQRSLAIPAKCLGLRKYEKSDAQAETED